ncbi:MAG: DNA-binding XRE family transcriptional regulator [Salibacteraceae bacterium]|jgi:DNA-binding XRE family transcriptional regulator
MLKANKEIRCAIGTDKKLLDYTSNNSYIYVMKKKEQLQTLSEKVRRMRKDKGLTQDQVREQIGVHIGRIELGTHDITYTTLLKLSEFFKKELNEFN